jgi:hypothetical protein
MADYPDPESAKHKDRENLVYSLGYCFDLFKAVDILNRLKESLERVQPHALHTNNLNLDVLQSLSSPVSRSQCDGGYRLTNDGERGGGLNSRPEVKLVPEQRLVINNLKCPIEIIQGPPGMES